VPAAIARRRAGRSDLVVTARSVRRVAATALGGFVVSGLAACGSPPPSACRAPAAAPTTLAAANASDPVAAANATGSAVVAWSSLTGSPVGLRLRNTALQWGAARTIGDYRTRNPAVAIDATGRPWIAFEGYDADEHPAVFVASGPDLTPRVVSRGQINAQGPQIAVAGDGTLIAAWITFVNGRQGTIAVSVHSAGAWSAPITVAQAATRVEHLSLAAAGDGSAVLAWTGGRGRAWATVRRPDGRWSTATVVSSNDREAIEPAVAAAPGGHGWVAWNESLADGSAARVAIRAFTDGSWGPPTTLDSAPQGPLQMPRPGQASLGPALAIAPDGALTAAWAIGTRDHSQVRTRTRSARGAWATTITLSDPDNQAGAPGIVTGPNGEPIVAWEEIDHNLLRARTKALAASTRCIDLTGAVTESSSIALAGGPHPIAAFVDLRRASVDVQALR
jgi:hypothetical protein